jgi:hypothetical protein
MVVADTGRLTTADSPVRHGPCPYGNHALRTRPTNTADRPTDPPPAGDLTQHTSRNRGPHVRRNQHPDDPAEHQSHPHP